jgi:dihydroflavonol-4-reductase
MAQVLVTGITGFIAKHVAMLLLEAGHEVRGTMRNLAKGERTRASLAAAGADVSRLELVEADLTSDEGWTEAVTGCDYVQHVASPFPLQQPSDREALVPAAVGGVQRVAERAFKLGAKRVVLTSSVAAMMYRAGRPTPFEFGEEDWTDAEWPMLTAYLVSKTRAERAFWDVAAELGATDRAVSVNPGFVAGPTLDADVGASLEAIEMFLKGAYPAVPPVAFPMVDVRDVAALHVAAMTSEGASGRRLLAAGETVSMQEMAKIMKAAYPARKIPTGQLPAWLIRLLSNFDRTMKAILPDLGMRPIARSAYVTELTGVSFRSAKEAVESAAASLIEQGVVK